MEFSLQFSMDNDDFSKNPSAVAAEILREVAQKVSRGKSAGKVMDLNGNSIGEWEIKEN